MIHTYLIILLLKKQLVEEHVIVYFMISLFWMLFVYAGDLRSDAEPCAQQLTLSHLLAGRWHTFLCILPTWAKIMGVFCFCYHVHTHII